MNKLANAIRDLILEYEKATKLEVVENPIAYALYQTWKNYDRKE